MPAIIQQPVSSNALVGFQKTTPFGSKSYRGRGGGGRGGFQSERSTVDPNRETLKFEEEYDFEKANEEFKVMLTAEKQEKLKKIQITTIDVNFAN